MADSNEELDKLAGDYKTIAAMFGDGLQGKVAIVTGSNTGKNMSVHLPHEVSGKVFGSLSLGVRSVLERLARCR